ncbi:MAG: hypothetical protein JXR83_22120 [Deltaproteobacteria bacterium]|nr:hypothetical protein [Deltaproteobacteria bacterium]
MKAITCSIAFALILGVACQPDDVSPLALRAGFGVAAATVDFGTLAVGERAAVALEVVNRGQVGLWLQMEIAGAPAAVFSAAADELYLEIGARRSLELAFEPDRPEPFAATLHLFDQADPAASEMVGLSGRGELPDCEDGNPCTEDLFELDVRACRHEPRVGPCDDGRRCTEDDRCVRGLCLGQPVVCADAVDCTIDACDEAVGCVAIPDHGRCAADDPCTAGRCDARTGCRVEMAADGTPCGDFSCAEMRICMSGECRGGPAPDGMPCDDGDLCTSGDVCRAGVCQPGAGVPLAASRPVDFLYNSMFANVGAVYYPYGDPTAVLAIHVPASGGLEVIWAYNPCWQDVAVQVMRTRLEAHGAIVSSELMFVAEQTRAAYDGDDLLTLVGGCRGCCSGDYACADPVAIEPCQLLLRRYPADGSPYRDVCVGNGGYDFPGLLALDVAGGTSHIALTAARLTDLTPPGANVFAYSVDRAGQVSSPRQVYGWDDPISSYVPNARLLQVAVADQRPLIALTHVEELGNVGCGDCCCSTCDCDSVALGQTWDYGGVLIDPATAANPTAARELHLGGIARGLGLSPGLGLSGWMWRQCQTTDDLRAVCSQQDELILFVDRGEQGVQQRSAVSAESGAIKALTATTFAGQPAALLLRSDGQLTVYLASADGDFEAIAVDSPIAIYSQTRRTFASMEHYYPFNAPAMAAAPIAGGLVVVALTAPYAGADGNELDDSPTSPQDMPSYNSNYGIAFFTLGCDATIPPRR